MPKIKKIVKRPIFWLVLILILAAFLRFYKINRVPPSLNWDEVAIGYNAYSILKTGRDEWGRKFPLLGFESFGEYKLPVFVYATVPGIWLFGLNELGVRFMPALFGILGVLVTFFLAKEIFKNEKVSLLSALVMAVDIGHLQITRAAFEAGLAQLLISLSILLLLKSKKKWLFLPLSFLLACLSAYTYNSSRIFIPLFFATIFLFNRKLFLSNKKGMLLGTVIILLFVIPLIFNFNKPTVRGRYQLISIQDDPGFILRINRARGVLLDSGWPPVLARLIHNKLTHYLWIFGRNYISHFTPQFLFISGADHTQQSLPGFGQLMVVWLLPLLAGLYFLLKGVSKNKLFMVILVQVLVAPVASSMTVISVPSALRIFCGLPAWQLIIAYGLLGIGQKLKNIKVGEINILYSMSVVFFIMFLLNLGIYLGQYYIIYPRDYSKDWQYGYKKAVRFMGENKDRYDKLFLTRDYGEPYMFFLFYNKYSPQKYQSIPKVVVNRSGWLMVDHFDKYYFPDFTNPDSSILEINKKEKGRLLFAGIPGDIPQENWIIERINYLNGEVAFEIGEAEEKVK